MKVNLLNQKRLSKRMAYLTTFLLLFLLFCLLYKSIGFYYRINDDTAMRRIAVGTYNGVPDGHLIFIRYLYGIFLLGLSFLCYGLLICRIFDMTEACLNKLQIRIVCLLILFITFFDSIILFQFTVVAGTVAVTALFLLITYDNKQGLGEYILIWLLYLIAALIRARVFLMTLPIFGLIVLNQLLKQFKRNMPDQKDKIKAFKAALPFLLISVLGLCLFQGISVIEDYAYSDEDWKTYNEFKYYRSLIYDYYGWPPYEGNEEFWSELGISKEEQACMGMFGILPDIDAEKLGQIAALSANIYSKTETRIQLYRIWTLLVAAIQSVGCREQHILLLAGILWLVFRKTKAEGLEKFTILGFLLVQMSALIFLLYRGRLPDRIIIIYDFQCILGALGFALVQLKEGRIPIDSVKIKKMVGGCMLTLLPLILFVFKDTLNTVKSYNVSLETYEEYLDYLCEEPNNIYVACTGVVSSKKKFTLHQDREISTLGTAGWTCKSPFIEERMEQLGLDPDSDILLTDGVYFVTADLSNANLLDRYYQSEKKTKAGYEIVDVVRLKESQYDIYVVKWL